MKSCFATEQLVLAAWEGNGPKSSLLESKESPWDNCWHIAETLSCPPGDISGIGLTVELRNIFLSSLYFPLNLIIDCVHIMYEQVERIGAYWWLSKCMPNHVWEKKRENENKKKHWIERLGPTTVSTLKHGGTMEGQWRDIFVYKPVFCRIQTRKLCVDSLLGTSSLEGLGGRPNRNYLS